MESIESWRREWVKSSHGIARRGEVLLHEGTRIHIMRSSAGKAARVAKKGYEKAKEKTGLIGAL